MNAQILIQIAIFIVSENIVNALSVLEKVSGVEKTCCSQGDTYAVTSTSIQQCSSVVPPEDIDNELVEMCMASLKSCCEQYFISELPCILKYSTDQTTSGMFATISKKDTCLQYYYHDTQRQPLNIGDIKGYTVQAINLNTLMDSEIVQIGTASDKIPVKKRDVSSCPPGYKRNSDNQCDDINECEENKHICGSLEECENRAGGYQCNCKRGYQRDAGRRCVVSTSTTSTTEHAEETSGVTPRPASSRNPNSNVVTVGTQYGQRGEQYISPTVTNYSSRETATVCPWGYKLTPAKMCIDIDECAKNISECGPQQRCENYYGGHSCRCPTGHRLADRKGCQDIDECAYGQPCPYLAQCVNTIGSFKCACGGGFRNAASDESTCEDVDECSDTPALCEQECQNEWGGYRCYCKQGYRMSGGNGTCADVDECAEWIRMQPEGAFCGGECVNTPGSYRCACAAGYRLSDNGWECIDIDECETGEARCARAGPEEVCINTRGGYHCHRIDCPQGYTLQSNHTCTHDRCPDDDRHCSQLPSTYVHHFITLVSNAFLPDGSRDLFTMSGLVGPDSTVTFDLSLKDVQAGPGVRPADIGCFHLQQTRNTCRIALQCLLRGSQTVQLELAMTVMLRARMLAASVGRVVLLVSRHEY